MEVLSTPEMMICCILRMDGRDPWIDRNAQDWDDREGFGIYEMRQVNVFWKGWLRLWMVGFTNGMQQINNLVLQGAGSGVTQVIKDSLE